MAGAPPPPPPKRQAQLTFAADAEPRDEFRAPKLRRGLGAKTLIEHAGAAQGRTSFKDDEAGRMANLLVTPAQETAAKLDVMKGNRGLLGDGFSYRIKAMSEISAAGARVNALKGLAGSDPAMYDKAKEELMGARARLGVSDREDRNMRAARNIDTGLARIGGGTDALAGSRRAERPCTTA